MNGKLILIAMCLVLVSFGTSWADYFLVDQQNMGGIDGWYNLSYYKFDQSFTPSLSTMSEVQIALHTTGESAKLRVSIRDGSINGPVVGSSEVQLAPDFTDLAQFTFRRFLHINPGSPYYIDLELLYGTAYVAISYEGGGYSQGLLYIDEYNTPTDNSDMVFQTGNVRSEVVNIISGADALCRGINLKDKLIIALVSNDVLDATRIDPESVTFAEAGVKRAGENGRLQCHQEDSNHDGLPDLICNIDVTQLGIEQGALSIDVTAETYDGMRIIEDEVLCGGQN